MMCQTCRNYQERNYNNGLCVCPVPMWCSCHGGRPMYVGAYEGNCPCWAAREGAEETARPEVTE